MEGKESKKEEVPRIGRSNDERKEMPNTKSGGSKNEMGEDPENEYKKKEDGKRKEKEKANIGVSIRMRVS